jgi:outer membrane protein assembly factor BamD (BamD/ComL family)
METFEIAEQVTDLDPALKRQARFQRAWVQYSNQAYGSSQPEFEAVYREAPDTRIGAEALFWSADAHYQTRNFGPAAQQYSEFIDNYPGSRFDRSRQICIGLVLLYDGRF